MIRTVRQVMEGTWEPVNYLGGMADGLVSLAPLTGNCAPGTQEAVQAVQSQMMEGSFQVFTGPIYDGQDNLQVEQDQTLTDQEILSMTWLCRGISLA